MKKSDRLNRILDEALVNSVVNEDSSDIIKNLGFTINRDYGTGRASSRLSTKSDSSAKEKSVSSGNFNFYAFTGFGYLE